MRKWLQKWKMQSSKVSKGLGKCVAGKLELEGCQYETTVEPNYWDFKPDVSNKV